MATYLANALASKAQSKNELWSMTATRWAKYVGSEDAALTAVVDLTELILERELLAQPPMDPFVAVPLKTKAALLPTGM